MRRRQLRHYPDRCSRCRCWDSFHVPSFLGPTLCVRCRAAASKPARTAPAPAVPAPDRIRGELQAAGWAVMRRRLLACGDPWEDSAYEYRGAIAPVRDVSDRPEPADLMPRSFPTPDATDPSLLATAYEWALEHVLERELDVFELIERPKAYGRRRMAYRDIGESAGVARSGGLAWAGGAGPSVIRGEVFPGQG